jgi:hypothetical protein
MIERLHWELRYFRDMGDELIAANRTKSGARFKTCSDSASFSWTKIHRKARRKLIWAHRVRAANKRGGPASQRSHPKARPAQQPYKRWRTPPIVRILQYHSGVVEQVRAESPHSFRVHGIYSSDLVLSDEGTDARAARVTFASFLDSKPLVLSRSVNPRRIAAFGIGPIALRQNGTGESVLLASLANLHRVAK